MRRSRRGRAAGTELRRYAADRSGSAIVMALLAAVVVFGVAGVVVAISGSETRVSANYQSLQSARYFAEGALERALGLQNDLSASPRHFFDPDLYASWASGPEDTTLFHDREAVAPLEDGDRAVGTIRTRILGKNPLGAGPPYRIEATATLDDGSSATYQVIVDALSVLDFAIFSDDDVYIGPNALIGGRVYGAKDVILTAPTGTFLRRVEYVGNLFNQAWGDFREGHENVGSRPSISQLVDIQFYANAAQGAGFCGEGRGLYIGKSGPSSVDDQTEALFRAYESGSGDVAVMEVDALSGCRDGMSCYLLDLGLLDFTASPITYAGVPLLGYDGGGLTDFNGVIYTDEELHVWGHLGGRSVEDETVEDARGYMAPPPGIVDRNLYSNDRLDAGEDGTGGGTADGLLDPRGLGTSLGIYAKNNLYIDHNIWAGTDSLGNPVRLGLVSEKQVRVDAFSPRAVVVQAAVLSAGDTWFPQGDQASHQPNDWARNGGDAGAGGYAFDLDADGVLETNTGMGQAGDRNETAMRDAWTLRAFGNLVVSKRASSGAWAMPYTDPHPRYYVYDPVLAIAEIPCYPTLSTYGFVSGSFAEITPVP